MTMDSEKQPSLPSANVPWNKGRLTGQKRPLKPKDVWAIRVRLQLEHRARDLALFNLAIDSQLQPLEANFWLRHPIAKPGYLFAAAC
jgi:hypothetical protein